MSVQGDAGPGRNDYGLRLGEYVALFFTFTCQVKLYHWAANAYGKHKALDELHGHLLDASDKFAESYMGLYHCKPEHGRGAIRLPLAPVVKDGNVDQVSPFLLHVRDWVVQLRRQPEIAETALDNILQDLESHIDQSVYLYRLR